MGSEKKLENYVMGSKRGAALIKYSGIYDLPLLVQSTRTWLLKREYLLIDKEHTEAVKTSGKEIKFDITAFRNVSDYVKFSIEIEIIILRSIDILVEENGEKVKKQQGDVEIRVKAFVQKNYKNTFKATSKFQEFLRQIFEKYIVKSTLGKYKEKLLDEVQSYIDEIKECMELTKR